MKLKNGAHLAYCTNVHPAETWVETFAALKHFVLAVKARVQPAGPYAIGLRLSDLASRELAEGNELVAFQRWLEQHACYVFTINGFPFGQFHGTRVKENVYAPDWSDPRRLDYTNRLFDLLVRLVPAGVEGSVSTLPGSFKDFITSREQVRAIETNLSRCVHHIDDLSRKFGRELHLGLEPEPFGLFENTTETLAFFEHLRACDSKDERLVRRLGVNYDTCHFAVEYEEPEAALAAFAQNDIRISKVHISNALRLQPGVANLHSLAAFHDEVYLHQVITRDAGGNLVKYRDLQPALKAASARFSAEEWRVHFHVPLHWKPDQGIQGLQTTEDHLRGVLRHAGAHPGFCSHFEMETYTWSVLPDVLRARDVIDQIVAEYEWTLARLRENGLADK